MKFSINGEMFLEHKNTYPKHIEITKRRKEIIETCRRPLYSPNACENCILSELCLKISHR